MGKRSVSSGPTQALRFVKLANGGSCFDAIAQ